MLDENSPPIRYVILVSADLEWQAVKEKLKPVHTKQSPYGEMFDQKIKTKDHPEVVCFFQGGWGKISAAAATQFVLDRFKPDCLINLGTCGGISGRIERGTIILVTETIVYDIIEQMGDYDAHIRSYTTRLETAFTPKAYPMRVFPTRLVSGDRDLLPEDVPWLVKKFDAVAADWESGAIAFVASRNDVPVLILRGVTDLVGENGGEAYGNISLFAQNVGLIMSDLVDHLGDWLDWLRR